MSNRWCTYGNWDEIAQLEDPVDIQKEITGHANYWDPNQLPDAVRDLIPSGSVIVDFGCGLGRNADLLQSISAHVIGYDIPEMISKLGQDSKYERTPSNLEDALDGAHVLYESVVIQHLISIDEILDIVQKIQNSSVQLVILLHSIHAIIPIDTFIFNLGWDLVLTQKLFQIIHIFFAVYKDPVSREYYIF